MKKKYELSNPVVVGGVGGSGTRVVAEILSILGFYIGSDLNSAMDNLWFTLLFKRPKWYQKACQDKDKIFTGFRLLSNAMIYRNFPSLPEVKFVLHAVVDIALSGHNYKGAGRGFWPLVRAWKMLTSRQTVLSNHIGWGWKEPNTHIYIDYMAEYFDHFKYIHVIRHGLDMAFSKNQQQLYNWGQFYGVEIPKSQSDVPKASLKYWVRANRRVFEIGKQLGNKNFLVVDFDKLCMSPKPEIERIIYFLGIRHSAKALDRVFNIPKRPKSLGRYQDHDLSQFDAADLEVLKTFGCSIHTHVS